MEAPPGLKGLVVTETEIGDVRGDEGFYHYRQYSAIDLARSCSLEEVWHLVFEGRLPMPSERAAFAAELAPLRALSPAVRSLLPALAAPGDGFVPLDALRTALSFACADRGLRSTFDLDAAGRRRDALFVCAQVPTLVAALWRLHEGRAPVDPDPSLGHAADYMRMLGGEAAADPAHVRAIEKYWIATVDHGFNASTFTARVIAGTGADVGAAVVGALGAFSGPLHGGSPARALDTLDAIGCPERIEEWVRAHVDAGERMMGFGHAVYRTEDPRAAMLRDLAEALGGERVAFARQVEEAVLRILAERKPGRAIHTNVEFYAGVVMEICGIPRELFTPTFAASRVIGWTANVLEQAATGRLIRPSARYVGPPAPQPLPAFAAA
jgi:citrate synthase